MIEQEKARKKEARRLIALPLNQRPDNVFYKAGTRLDFGSYMVQFDDIGVYFQFDGKRMYYLGEYPASNWSG